MEKLYAAVNWVVNRNMACRAQFWEYTVVKYDARIIQMSVIFKTHPYCDTELRNGS